MKKSKCVGHEGEHKLLPEVWERKGREATENNGEA